MTESPKSHPASPLLLALLAVVVTLWWSQPLWLTVGRTGGNDWGVMLTVWEVRWKTLEQYSQWPAFNPWQGGGLPMNPSLGYFSVQALCTFMLGPEAGLSVFILVYLAIGVWGFWQLGWLLFENAFIAFVLAVLGTASPAFVMHLSIGHLPYANYLIWPAIIYWLLRASVDRWAGLKSGLLFALGFNEIAFYIMQYGAIITALLGVWRLWQAGPDERAALRRYALLAVICSLPFMFPSLIAILTIARDYARVANTPASFTAAELWRAYFVPVTEFKPSVYVPLMRSWWGTWEIHCYLGWGATILFGFGLARSARWFHAALAGCFVFTLGNLHWWEPMRWLMETPAFASLQSFNRLRLFTHHFFAIGVCWGLLMAWNHTRLIRFRPAVAILATAALIEILTVSRLIASRSHFDFTLPEVSNSRGGEFYQRAERIGLPAVIDGWPADLVAYTRANIGIVREPAAIDSSFRLPSRVRTINDSDYIGEFVQAGRPVRPAYWSPNRITFEALDPNEPLYVNFNRGYPWRNFDRPLFPNDRVVEFEKPFTVQPNSEGRVDLSYVLPAKYASWWAALALLGVAAAFCLYLRRRENNPAK